jgi:hypothetical protein
MNRQEMATWNGKHDRLATLLAQGRGVKDAATEIGVGERTAHRWLEDPRFRVHISELRSRMLDATLGRLTDSATKAVDKLVDLLDAGRLSVQVRAALGILDAMMQIREHLDFDQGISALEAKHAGRPEIEDLAN